MASRIRTPTLPPIGAELGRATATIPSTLPPPDAGTRGTGRNGRGRQVTVEALDGPFVHVTGGYRGQVGMGGDPRGGGGATCKIAGIADEGSPNLALLPENVWMESPRADRS